MEGHCNLFLVTALIITFLLFYIIKNMSDTVLGKYRKFKHPLKTDSQTFNTTFSPDRLVSKKRPGMRNINRLLKN